MARFLSQTLIRSTSINPSKLGIISQPNRFSSRSGNPRLPETDLESSSSSSSSDSEVALRRFEDVFHNMIVKQSTPDWVPFVPGSSYWVPPINKRESDGLYRVLKTFTTSFDQAMAVSSSPSRGWPSSAYFIQGTLPVHPIDVNADKNRENVFQSEDEEG